jgi:phospholipid/cholesterol/gamma-HCH transport system substrate-binding protein
MRRGRAQSLAASPTLVGAITTLIVIVAVFLAYNSNNGLPFVPTYRVSVILPNAARVSPNNEVRIGGTRVGVVESIEPVADQKTGRAAAKLDLKLDKSVEPLPDDSTVQVRYKSSFGLKYLEVKRGTGPGLKEGSILPVSQASTQTEFDDISNTFDARTREASRQNLLGYGDALAARGASLNQTIQALNPLFTNLKPVARTLTAPNTRLERFFPALGRTAEIVAPVAEQQAELFTNMAITFGALSEDPQALKDTISSGPPTLAEGTPALRAQRPFLTDFADLSQRLVPGVRALRHALPTLNSALVVGRPVLEDTPPVNAKLKGVFTELRSLVRQPQTKTSLLRLRETFDQAAPAATFIAPFQTVCNYFGYWTTFFPEHLSQRDDVGFTQRVSIIGVPNGAPFSTAPPPGFPLPGLPPLPPPFDTGQPAPFNVAETPIGGYSGLAANGKDSSGRFKPRALPILHGNPYGPAVDENGNADCQTGQVGYLLGDLRVPGQPASNPAVGVSNIPGNRGTTFNGRTSIPAELHPRSLP